MQYSLDALDCLLKNSDKSSHDHKVAMEAKGKIVKCISEKESSDLITERERTVKLQEKKYRKHLRL